MPIETNKIYQGDCLTIIKSIPDESIDCIITSPPYWGLRDYDTSEWVGGDEKCDHEIINKIKPLNIEWDRPSRKEFNKIGIELKCPVCGVLFKSKTERKFCSIDCLNTLSNEQRKKISQERIEECKKCGAKKVDRQIGIERTIDEYLNHLLKLTKELKRVLKPTGTLFWVHGDSYSANRSYQVKQSIENTNERQPTGIKQPQGKDSGIPEKSLTMQPYRLAMKMIQEQSWILRNIIIWQKPSTMPESVNDRFTMDFEPIMFFVKNKKYYFEQQFEPFSKSGLERMKYNYSGNKKGIDRNWQGAPEGEKSANPNGRNKRTTWSINPKRFEDAHFAVFPDELIEPMINAGCPRHICSKCGKIREKVLIKQTICKCNATYNTGIVLDPFMGSGTTALVALKLGRKFIGIELNKTYIEIANKRIKGWLEQKTLLEI